MKKVTLLLAGLACFTMSFAQFPTNGLKSSYPLDANADDSFGNFDGTLTNFPAPTINRAGLQNKAIETDGFSSYIEIPYNIDAVNKTINIWFYADTITNEIGTIFSMNNGNIQNGLILLAVQRQGGIDQLLMSAGAASVSYALPSLQKTWHMLTLADNGNVVTHYFDGGMIGTNTNAQLHSIDGYDGITLGTSRATFNRFLSGKVDDLLLYERELGSIEILDLYNNTLTNTFVDDQSAAMVKVYPNPTQNFVTVSLPQNTNLKTIELFNSLGQKVISSVTRQSEFTLNLSELSVGMYSLLILDEDNTQIAKSKLLKE